MSRFLAIVFGIAVAGWALTGCSRPSAGGAAAEVSPKEEAPLVVKLPYAEGWDLTVSAGSVEGPAGGLAVNRAGAPVIAMPDGAVLRLSGSHVETTGRLLPTRGRLGRTHQRFLGSHSHPDLDHWYRDIFRDRTEVKVVDEVGLKLGKRASIVMLWDVHATEAPTWTMITGDTGRLAWGGFVMDIHSNRSLQASLRQRVPGIWRLRLATEPDSSGLRIVQTLRHGHAAGTARKSHASPEAEGSLSQTVVLR